MKTLKKTIAVILSVVFAVSVWGASFPAWASRDRTSNKELRFRPDGTFKVLQIADIQWSGTVGSNAKKFIGALVREQKPDLIALTGDNIYGGTDDAKNIKSFMDIFELYGIPVAATFGNHDDEGSSTKEQQMVMYQGYSTFVGKEQDSEAEWPAGLAYDSDLWGAATYNLPILKSDRSGVGFNLWFFDGNSQGSNYYDIRQDQMDWYRARSNELKAANGGEVVPSLVFQHIIPTLIKDMGTFSNAANSTSEWNKQGVTKISNYLISSVPTATVNYLGEDPCPPNKSDPVIEYSGMEAQGDVLAIVVGHDHVNNYNVLPAGHSIRLICTGSISSGSITNYNYWSGLSKTGWVARTFVINENDPTHYTTAVHKWDTTNTDGSPESSHTHAFAAPQRISDPTCTAEGEQYITCTACSNSHYEGIAALGHDFSILVKSVAAIHTADGVVTYKCTRCDATNDVLIPRLQNHDFSTWLVTKEPTHMEEGAETATCPCGETVTRSTARLINAHSYENWTVTTPPTHSTYGVETGTCVCGTTQTRQVAKTGDHTYGPWEVILAPTHRAYGTECAICTVCNDIIFRQLPKVEGHTFSAWIVSRPATHTEEGIQVRTCPCGEMEGMLLDKLPDHVFGAWRVTTAPTHDDEGIETRTCPCGETETRTIPKSGDGHYFGEWEMTLEPTHSTPGEEQRICLGCGYTETRAIPILTDAHIYKNWRTIKEATHTEPGEEAGYCECDAVGYRYPPRLEGHTFSAFVKTETPATHLDAGVAVYQCACGATEQREIPKTASHTYTYTVAVAATHTAVGTEIGVCACGSYTTRSIAKTPTHSYTDWVTTLPATHLTTGTEIGTCACGQTTTRTLPKTTAHTFSVYTVTRPATHTATGSESATCACGTVDTRTIPKLAAHTYPAAWLPRTAATCTVDGLEYHVCTAGDGAEETRTIPALGHSYTSAVTQPTATAGGYTTHRCTRCGVSYTDSYTQPTGGTKMIWLWGKETRYASNFFNWLLCIICFGWIWMAF